MARDHASAPSSLSAEEYRLYKSLMTNYHKLIRPRKEWKKPVDVTVSFSLWQIKELDEKNQVLKTFGWLEFVWFDEFLRWNTSEFSNITEMILPAEDVWLPDVNLGNSANKLVDSSFTKDFKVEILSTGRVLWTPGGSFETSCSIDITYFPFDRQKCFIRFANGMYSGILQSLTNATDGVGLTKYTENGEWNITKTGVRYFDDYFSDGDGALPYPTVDFIIYMSRKPLYYIINIVVPCAMSTVLVTFVFLLPPEAGEKISLGITVLLSFSVFLLLVADQIPKISDYIPLIAIYLTSVMALSATSIMLTVIILQIHHHDALRRPPSWLRYITFEIMAPLLCLKTNNFYLESSEKYGIYQTQKKAKTNNSNRNTADAPMIDSVYDSPQRGRLSYKSQIRDSSDTPDIKVIQVGMPRRDVAMDTEDALNNEDSDRNKWKLEWQTTAKILDRFLLVFFLLTLTVFSAVFLGILPSIAEASY